MLHHTIRLDTCSDVLSPYIHIETGQQNVTPKQLVFTLGVMFESLYSY